MAKRLKLRISRVLPYFQSCRSKDPSSLPSNTTPSFLRHSSVNHNSMTLRFTTAPTTLASSPPAKLHHFSLKRHVSFAFSSMGCGPRSRTSKLNLSETEHTQSLPPQDFQWGKEGKFHVIARVYDPENESPRRKIYNFESDDVLPPPPPPNTLRKNRRHKKENMAPKFRISASSADSGIFSSSSFDDINIKHHKNVCDEEETETLFSSLSFSTDSSYDFNTSLETIRETPISSRRKKFRKATRRSVLKQREVKELFSPECESPARLSMFLQRLIPCAVDGKVRESFAVVKRSQDPYEDFKRSMMEMILEKQMFEEKDLEQLLHCFLSLNSRQHHGVIVQAFVEIWDVLFVRRSPSSC
ncbi:Ovate domain-containing protein [Cephalotus follicularis]|uniref:Transcription repressor n=1 Tax=Cephalotus follicularis TaxID=3775 RepID=A0A1Q3BNS1_CEPFO|nr:Ovate domain-containing protein [Cephalotus follicularis]